jgi:phosphoribosylglycinamide formyltransferase-1
MVMPANGGGALIAELQSRQIDLLLLAGYLRLLPEEVIQAMGGMVVNTHPSLLPEFGGPGMYGRYVHEAVAAAGVAESGASLHWVSGDYDSGEVIEQVRVKLPSGSTAGEVEELVRAAEREWLPGAIGRLVATWKNASLNRPEPS